MIDKDKAVEQSSTAGAARQGGNTNDKASSDLATSAASQTGGV